MGERKEIQVSQEEILKQKQYIQEVKQISNEYEQKTGRKKTFRLQTFGCQMNENDSERLAGMLSEMGYMEAPEEKAVDLVIFNTCCVRENAEVKVYGHLGALKKLKSENPGMIIAICGCMMQQPQIVEHIKSKYRHVDLIFGTHNLYMFPQMLNNALISGTTVVDVWTSEGLIAENMPIERKDGIKAWITIMYGCNNFCSYCIVPYVRGRERSRQPDDIVGEISSLGSTFKEITLLGQNVNSYGKDKPEGISFAQLLHRIDKVEDIERVRFMTSHPKDLSDDLIEAIRDCKKVCEHLHLPIQAGSTRILKEMNRKYSKEAYLELVQKVKKAVPGIALTTDIIVGFPGETDEDFDETLDVIEKVRYDSAYTFLYSKRTGTPAAKSLEQVSEEDKKKRFDKLLELQNKISREINEQYMGMDVEVLVEGFSKNNPNKLTGRTRTSKIINFTGPEDLIGRLVNVNIKEIQTWSLEGILKDN